MTDKILYCRDCRKNFKFTQAEQEFFIARGLQNEPKRCGNCRLLFRARQKGIDISHLGDANCADCGEPTKLPFAPKGYSPVYCMQCYKQKSCAVSN